MELAGKKILVVDDYAESRATLAKMLSKLHVDVLEAPDGETALTLMTEHQPVVVLLDADMPDVDGYQVVNRMQSNEKARHLPVIMMTSNLSDRRQKLHKPLLDVIDFVNKPINEITLLSKVESHLELDHYRNVIRTLHSDNEKLLEAMHEGVLGIDADGVIRFANSAAAYLLRTKVSKLQDTYLETIFEEPNHQAHSNWAEHPVAQVCAKKSILQVESADFWRADGSSIKVKFAAVPMDDLQGMSVVLAFKELAEKRENKEAFSKLTNTDYLTGLPSRVRFEDLMKEALHRATSSQTQLAVLVINLDHFRNINDSLGHDMGDKLLKAVGDRMVQTIRKNDVFARIGGDEFALLVEPLDSPEGAATAAEKIMNTLKYAFLIEGHEIFSSCSIGIATYPACGDNTPTLLKNADIAVSKAKEEGGSRFQYYSSEVNATIMHRIELERDLHQVLEREELVLRYQPVSILDAKGNRERFGVEAQLYWECPKRGVLDLHQFLSVAEDINLFPEMARWMYGEALTQLKAEADQGVEQLFVYVSPKVLLTDGFVEAVTRLLNKFQVKGEQIAIEVCESYFMRQRERMLAVLLELHALGVKITMTDFGLGYGAFELLRGTPVDVIRLPDSFIEAITSKGKEEVICRHVVAMAHELGIKVWAARVDDQETLAVVKALGVDLYQGAVI